ncbi:Gp138 family membrane-puncturing spike protein [Helicobacter sp. MIT 05-5294]|uniref:Gp138 family membrane-puncturing spike protein n=1 Tax=Helicobacter sp. MIT 05-5294 TaxID=1548150 RepID=UPI00051FE466|nr:Gp138 family membrane-puncturing spike protein [Helicobacter sp. MIT 05-5294]TLD85789.1 hypothetical protein LS69_007795 [Helicobacter sp. MIT 05-5294]
MPIYKTNIDIEEQNDLGLAIQKLIESNIRNSYTSYLAKIVSIAGNKLHIQPIIKSNKEDKEVVINNALIAFPFSGNWRIQYKLKVNDIGLVIVADKDITNYKNSGKDSIVATKRFKNINDAIFFPVSMFQTLDNDSINFTLVNQKGNCALTFGNDEIGTLKAKLLTIQSENTTLKAELKKLASLLESLASGKTQGDTHSGTRLTTSPDTIGKFNSWASGLDNLFKS